MPLSIVLPESYDARIAMPHSEKRQDILAVGPNPTVHPDTQNTDLTTVDGSQPGDTVPITEFCESQDGVKIFPVGEDTSASLHAQQGGGQ
jgi:hypothetical protein